MTYHETLLAAAECARVRAQMLSQAKDYAGAQREYNEQAAWLKVANKQQADAGLTYALASIRPTA